MIPIFVLILILIFVLIVYWYVSIPKNLPPGPIGLPFIGTTLTFWDGSIQHVILQEYAKKYGPVYKTYIADRLVIVLGDFEVIQEAFAKQGDVFAGRPQLFGFSLKECRNHGVVLSEGDLWREHRRFALSTLRDFGVGRPLLETRIKEEIEFLSERISEYASTNTPFNPQRLLLSAVTNVVGALVIGKRFSYDDQEFLHHFINLSQRHSGGKIGFLSPFLLSEKVSILLSFLPMVRNVTKQGVSFLEFIEREMKKTIASFDPQSDPSNYVHAYMKAANESHSPTFTDIQLLTTVVDLFMAGSDSTSTTIRWAILYLALHPQIQDEMYKEIKNHVGVHCLPNYADRIKLPFTEAIIMETQRLGNFAPLGILHRTMGDTKLMGYDIPENSIVVPLLINILHNAQLYPEPQRFDPSRFLHDGKVIRDQKFIPFQIGKRICLGEGLARTELFLFLVALISRFRFYFPPHFPKPTMQPVTGMTFTPVEYDVFVEARNE